MASSIPPFQLDSQYDNPGKFWERPPRRARGEKDWLPLYLAIGRFLSQWELLEMCFGELFSTLVESPSLAPVRVYGALGNVIARIDAIRFAAEVFFIDKPKLQINEPILKKLLSNYSEASARRNDVAHGVVTYFANGDIQIPGGYFVPPDYMSRRTRPKLLIDQIFGARQLRGEPNFAVFRHPRYLERVSYAYTSADIRPFTEKFYYFAFIVYEYSNMIALSLNSGKT